MYGAGDHEYTPGPVLEADNCNVSISQINVSLKGTVISGLSLISTSVETVSIQPLLLSTVNVTFTIPGSVYFQEGVRVCEVSFVLIGSPKSQLHLFANPYLA